MTAKQTLISIQMGSDQRIPRNALGYVLDLGETSATAAFLRDRLQMLSRYVPDLVAEFQAAASSAE